MTWLLAALLAAFLVYLIYEQMMGTSPMPIVSRKRLCDYTVNGSVYEDIPSALKRGVRLLEVHVYSDEQDQPVVATTPQTNGRDFADNNISFEQVCIDIVNDAFPSKDPLILSIVPHTDKSVTLNKIAEHLETIPRAHLVAATHISDAPIDTFANKLLIVSGRVHGTALESLVNLSWDDEDMRRLSYQQALHPRDPEELQRFNRDFITLVAPDPDLQTITVNPKDPLAYGCQWNLFDRAGSPGFVEKLSRS